jgi:hypothetical protein
VKTAGPPGTHRTSRNVGTCIPGTTAASPGAPGQDDEFMCSIVMGGALIGAGGDPVDGDQEG